MNFNVQACPGRRPFGGDCSSSYYLAAFGRDNSYLRGLNTHGDLGFRVARVPAIREPSILVIWSLLGPLGVTPGPWRRRLGDDRFCVFASGPSTALLSSNALLAGAAGRGAPEAERPGEPAIGWKDQARVCKVLGLFLGRLPYLAGFTSAPVFGIEQTEGDLLPDPDPEVTTWLQSLPLLEVAREWGLSIYAYNGRPGAPLGKYRHGRGIALAVQNLSTSAHEMCHAADDRLGNLQERGQHWRSETVAELGGAILPEILGYQTESDRGGCPKSGCEPDPPPARNPPKGQSATSSPGIRDPNGREVTGMSLSEQLKAAIEKADARGETRYKIAQESRVDYTVLVRFLDLGTSIRLQTVDRLCDYLGLELKPKPASRK